jgi:hypothetical protein
MQYIAQRQAISDLLRIYKYLILILLGVVYNDRSGKKLTSPIQFC